MAAGDFTESPFNELSGEDAPAVQSALTTLKDAIPEAESAIVALQSGTVTTAQRDAVLASVLAKYVLILRLILGRAS